MKAWRVHELGEPRDVLRFDEVPRPEPGPDQLLVKIRAAALNFPDVLVCQGRYQERPPLPFTPGVELTGEVISHRPPPRPVQEFEWVPDFELDFPPCFPFCSIFQGNQPALPAQPPSASPSFLALGS
jgi:hypothetical protein